MKDISKMEGKTNFSRDLKQFVAWPDWPWSWPQPLFVISRQIWDLRH